MAKLNEMILNQSQPSVLRNFSCRRRFATEPGLGIPFYWREVQPDDKWTMNFDLRLRTAPLLAPLMGSFEQQICVFFVPFRLYQQQLDTNRYHADITQVQLPIEYYPMFVGQSAIGVSGAEPAWYTATYWNRVLPVFPRTGPLHQNYSVGAGSLLDFLNILPAGVFPALDVYGGFGTGSSAAAQITTKGYNSRDEMLQPFSAIPLYAYYDIFRNYYANTQEDDFYMVSSSGASKLVYPEAALDASGAGAYPLIGLDNLINNIVAATTSFTFQASENSFSKMWFDAFVGGTILGEQGVSPTLGAFGRFKPFFGTPVVPNSGKAVVPADMFQIDGNTATTTIEQLQPASLIYSKRFGGLWYSTYRPDFMTAWLSKSSYDEINNATAVSTESSQFTINQLRFANHLQEFRERGILGGSRLDDWIYAEYGIHCDRNLCIPQLLNVIRGSVVFNEVVSNSNTPSSASDADTGLGDLGGRGVGFIKNHPTHFYTSEHGIVMCIYTLTPIVSYSQGQHFDAIHTQMSDLYWPSLRNIGFQPVFQRSLSITNERYFIPNQSGYPAVGALGVAPSNAFAYQPAYTEYTTEVDRVYGDFELGQDLDYWVLQRSFLAPTRKGAAATTGEMFHYSSYILPWQFEYPFVETSNDAGNFIVEIGLDIKVRRRLGKVIQPSL